MQFPLTFWDIGLWLTFTTLILLITAGLISPYYGQTNLLMDKKKLKAVALAMSLLFFIMVAIRVCGIMVS